MKYSSLEIATKKSKDFHRSTNSWQYLAEIGEQDDQVAADRHQTSDGRGDTEQRDPDGRTGVSGRSSLRTLNPVHIGSTRNLQAN